MDSNEKPSEDLEFYRIKLLLHLNLEDRILISNLMQENYKAGFLNGMSLRKAETNSNQNKKNYEN